MSMVDVRKTRISVDEVWRERGARHESPLLVGAALAVVSNPFAGRYEPDLMPFMAELRALGSDLSRKLIGALGGAEAVESYGKAAIVGEDGELEHGAVWHEAGGWALREALGDRKAIVPSAKTIAGIGARLMVPLGHTRAAYVRSHFGTAEITLWDGPRRDEILFGLVAATGARIDARLGGLASDAIIGEDGQR